MTRTSLLLLSLVVCCALTSAQKLDASYNPRVVDWAAVVSACQAAARYERRMVGFVLRAAFHDAGSINVTCWNRGEANCGGADASLLLNQAEWARSENGMSEQSFAKRTTALISLIAAKYGTSYADALAVCGATMTIAVAGGDALRLSSLRVGRIDSAIANPSGILPAADIRAAASMAYFQERNFTVQEATALIGVHVLLPQKACVSSYSGTTANTCQPYNTTSGGDPTSSSTMPLPGTCATTQMFTFDNRYYIDACTRSTVVGTPSLQPAVVDLSQADYTAEAVKSACRYSSDAFRQADKARLLAARANNPPLPAKNTSGMTWTNTDCATQYPPPADARPGALPLPSSPAITANCPHPVSQWYYTRSDGFMGTACQAPANAGEGTVQRAMHRYVDSNGAWLRDFALAYSKMTYLGAKWSANSFFPYFKECPSGWINSRTLLPDPDCGTCAALPAGFVTDPALAPLGAPAGWTCPLKCICSKNGYKPVDVLPVDPSF